MSENISYRLMERKDILEVVAIEEEAFATPWTEEIFEHEMSSNNYAHYIVAVEDDKVIGHFGMWIVIDECQITNIAVLLKHRGRGIGEALLRNAMDYCAELEVRVMTLEVRVSNRTAQNLYRKMDFQDGGIRKRYYTDDHEDALVMWVELK